MRTLLISTTEPSRKTAGWLYIEGLSKVFSEHSEIHFWFSLLNQEREFKKTFTFNFTKETVSKNYVLLKLRSLFRNSYIVHAYHKEHLTSLKRIMIDFQPDVVVFTNLSAGSYVSDVKNIKSDVKTVLVQHNVEYSVACEYSKYGKDIFQRFYFFVQKQLINRFEEKIMKEVDHIISISPSDKKIFQEKYSIQESKIHIIKPVFNYTKNLYNKIKNERIISFISSFDWYPNVKGTQFFVEKVFPNLLKKFPDLKLYLVGRNPVGIIYKLGKKFPENIVITGAVDDIYYYYGLSSCIAIPIFLGPGIKLKVLEAMASGVPTVMTSYVAKDYDLLDKGFCIADTPEEFVEHISKVLTDSEFANEISKRQVQWYENYLISERRHAEEVIKTILFSDSKNENN